MTGQEIQRVEESEMTLLPAKQAPSQHAMAVLMEASEAMDIAYRYALSVCKTQVCPARFRGKAQDGAAAILYGLEVGLSPAQSLQRVVVIHGMPSLEARTMVGLLQARGYQVSVWKISDTAAEVWGWYPHSPKVFGTDPEDAETFGKRLNPDSTSLWTIERATQAGYVPTINPATGKYRLNTSGKLIGNEKYITDPQAMLKAKGQAEVSRDLAPEVLMGIQYATEDLQSEQWDGTISVERPRPQPITVDEILSDAAPATPADRAAEQTMAEVNQMTPEEAKSAYDATETAQTVSSVREPEAGPVESRVSTEALSEEPQAAEPPDSPEAPAPAPEAAGDDEPGPNAPSKVKQLFALLREGGISGKESREDRLIIFRDLAGREDINSTNDLGTRDLNRIVAKLKGWSDAGTIAADCAEILWKAAAAEAAEEDAATTNENE